MTTTTATSEEYDGPKYLAMTTYVSAEDEGYTTHTRDCRQQRRRRGIDNGPEKSTTTTEASDEEDEHKDNNNNNNNNNRCVGRV